MNEIPPNSMSLSQARATLWAFKEHRGQPIGLLLDGGHISLSDLWWAYQNAFEKYRNVREAARTILLHHLAEIQDAGEKGSVNVVPSRYTSFAERRQMQWSITLGFMGGIFSTFPLFVYFYIVLNGTESNLTPAQRSALLSEPLWLLVLLLVLILIVAVSVLVPSIILNILTPFIMKQIRISRRGRIGEDRVVNMAYQALDSDWWLFPNVELPKRWAGDIDFVLVGPTGIWCLEVKNFAGRYRNTGDRWEIEVAGRWWPARVNPSRQVKKNAAAISGLLKMQHNIQQWVHPIVVWIGADATLKVAYPSVEIWHIDQVAEKLQALRHKPLIVGDTYTKAAEMLMDIQRRAE